MKKIFGSLLFFIVLFIGLTTVKAGTITANYISNDNVKEGEIINVKINISNVSLSEDGKMYSLGGYITYDKEYLELISFEGENNFTGIINDKNNKIALMDYSLEKGCKSGVIGTITFKALKSGKTTISFRNPSGTDLEKNLDVTFNSKEINIKTKEIKETKKVVKETKKEVKEVKPVIKEIKKEISENIIIESFNERLFAYINNIFKNFIRL